MKTNYLNKQIKQFLLSTALFTGLVATMQLAYAGDRAGNGGSGNEVAIVAAQKNISDIAAKIEIFFKKNQEAREEFPEIDFERLFSLIKNTRFEVTEEKLTDKNNLKRTCLNFPGTNLIQCDLNELLLLEKDVPSQFLLIFHEILGLLGVEESSPLYEDLSDSYKISQRLKKYVTKVDSYDLIYKTMAEERKLKVITPFYCHYTNEGRFFHLFPSTKKVLEYAHSELHKECAKNNLVPKDVKTTILSNRTEEDGQAKCRYVQLSMTYSCSSIE